MRLLTNLVFKVTLSSMILTAPAMITGHANDDGGSNFLRARKGPLPFYTSAVIRKFVDHPSVVAMRAFPREKSVAALPMAVSVGTVTAAVANITAVADIATVADVAVTAKAAEKVVAKAAEKVAEKAVEKKVTAMTTVATTEVKAAGKSAELRMVIRQATLIYTAMDLQNSGLDPKAFEYAWRGYHNLLKKGLIHRRSVLSICDFSQSSRNKRMYVIDVQHKKLLYRTYVAHGQNSGDEFATSFSNEPDSYKSSLGFYITQKTYLGRNGLSLRLDGVDSGYNDMAMKRMIVLHGSSYASQRYMEDYGNLGTSLGCPALPLNVSARIIRSVKEGSCLFIYHPTPQYLDNSTVLHG